MKMLKKAAAIAVAGVKNANINLRRNIFLCRQVKATIAAAISPKPTDIPRYTLGQYKVSNNNEFIRVV
jgi:hypothetical protein